MSTILRSWNNDHFDCSRATILNITSRSDSFAFSLGDLGLQKANKLCLSVSLGDLEPPTALNSICKGPHEEPTFVGSLQSAVHNPEKMRV